MVGIQVGNEQEERKGEEGGFEKIKDFNVSGNAGEDFCGSDDGERDDDMTFDMKLQLGGKEKKGKMYLGGLCITWGVYAS